MEEMYSPEFLESFREEQSPHKEERSSKRYKSSDESSFKIRESGACSFNFNATVEDEEDEVQEVHQSRPIGIDQAKRKAKAGTSSASSAHAFNVESSAKLMANEYAMSSDPYNVQKAQEMTGLLRIKTQELELKAAELEIRRLKNRQRDEALYLSTTNEELKAILRQRLFG
ncbi:hypothetical protein Tco_1209905 [Tanacetum coccineum]